MTILCSACGHQNTDTAKFCLKCGAPVASATAGASSAVQPPEVAATTVQQTPFGSVNVNVTVTPRPPPLAVPPPFVPKPAPAAPVSAAPAASSGGRTGLIIGLVVVAAIAGAAFVFLGKGKTEVPVAAAAPAAPQATGQQPLTSKEILNQVLGLARDNRWPDVKIKTSSLKGLAQVTKGNRANSEKLTQEATQLLESGNTADAISRYEKAIAEDASYADPRFLLGRALSRSGKPDAARLVLVDALVLEPDRGGTWLSAAEVFAEMNKAEESASALKLAIYFATNRDGAMKYLQDKAQFESAKFWAVIETNRSNLNGVPAYK